jgi:hypothetical protein
MGPAEVIFLAGASTNWMCRLCGPLATLHVPGARGVRRRCYPQRGAGEMAVVGASWGVAGGSSASQGSWSTGGAGQGTRVGPRRHRVNGTFVCLAGPRVPATRAPRAASFSV